MGEVRMSRRKYSDYQNDPAVHEILKDVLRSSKKSYYRVNAEGKHVIAPVKLELMSLHINTVFASRILQEYPFPVGKFIRNRKIGANITEDVLAARLEKKAIREQAKTAAKVEKESDTMKAIQAKEVSEPVPAIEEVSEESPVQKLELSVNETDERHARSKKSDPDEELSKSCKNHCLIKRGVWWGIYHTRDGTVHLISKARSEAVEVLARYGRVKECHRWN